MKAEARPTTEVKVAEMIRRIAEGFQPDKIIVLGSRARETAGPDNQAIEIEMKLGGLGLSKDVIVITPEEFTAYRDVVGSIVYPASHEGYVVYERTGK